MDLFQQCDLAKLFTLFESDGPPWEDLVTGTSLLSDGERAWQVGRVEAYRLFVFRSDVRVDLLWQSVRLSLSSRMRQ